MTGLLKTKLYAPRPHPAPVLRPHLLVRLDDGLRLGRRLTLVAAPAGYGKTTLATQWLRQAGRPFAWLSLDEGDNDPIRFVTYLAAAVSSVAGEGAGRSLRDLATNPPLPPGETLAALVINDLVDAPAPFTLVLDDYHTINTDLIHQLVQTLVEHGPPAFHLVLATRVDPPLPLSRWRARGQLTELRASDIQFSQAETGQFLNECMQLSLEHDLVEALQNRTEGWPAGLQLAALSLQGRSRAGATAFIQAFRGSHRHIIDYLMDEVLGQQDEPVRRFLCRTAVLDRLCAPLCDALTGRTNSKALLARLEQANLFLVPLDEERHWYRYHHLFADVLQTELTVDEARELHLAAARWHAEHGTLSDAVRHGLASGDGAEAARLVGLAAAEALHGGQAGTLLAWIDRLPAPTLQASPELLVYRAWAFFMAGRLTEAAAAAEAGGRHPRRQGSAVDR